MTDNSARYTLQQTAILLLQLCRLSELTRLAGSCVGELQRTDIVVCGAKIARSPVRRYRRFRHRLAQRRHLRRGHDQYCFALGVPQCTLTELLEGWGGEEVAAFLFEIVREGLDQLTKGSRHGMSANEVITHEIGRHLTVEAPADSLLAQIPRIPSKFASSRRALTWSRNRAASAPSTIR